MQEIGSEFHLIEPYEKNLVNNYKYYFEYGKEQCLFISGRTALDYVLKDILNDCNHDIECAYLPIYCCDSMIDPFYRNHIKVKFYNVKVLDGKLSIDLPKNIQNCILLGMSYFGFKNLTMDNYYEDIKNKYNTLIVEDTTHRFLSNENYSADIDYAIASLRKWFPMPSGGIAIKMNDYFFQKKDFKKGNHYVNDKIEAMSLKKDYLEGKVSKNSKEDFLLKYKNFNNTLQINYSNIGIDSYSRTYITKLNIESVKKKRIENATFLRNGLRYIDEVSFLTYESEDVPLFFPVIVDNPYDLQSFLSSKNIFCPRHWPKPETVKESKMSRNKLYEKELSIICDQRYGIKEMEYIIEVIKDYYS